MKASITFRKEQKPLFRAKIPLNITGLPLRSGIVAGESKELSLNLITFFESGPSLKVAYRPNDSVNPFSLVFKTGIGHFGSPISGSFNMGANFSFIGGSRNPSFFVHFNPHFGDFTIKKTQSPVFKKQTDNGGMKFSDLPVDSPASGMVNEVVSDLELNTTSAVPIRKKAKMNFRWGVRVPLTEETVTVQMMKNCQLSTAGISLQKLPVFLIGKVGIEHVAPNDCKPSSKAGPVPGDVADAFLGVKKQLEIIQAENGALRKAMDNLQCEISAVKSGANAVRYNGGDKGNKDLDARFGGKAMEGELVNDEM